MHISLSIKSKEKKTDNNHLNPNHLKPSKRNHNINILFSNVPTDFRNTTITNRHALNTDNAQRTHAPEHPDDRQRGRDTMQGG